MLEFVLARYNYWIVIALMMTGLYIVFSRGNLVKTLIGLNLFQTSVFIFYITVGKVIGGTAPILMETKGSKETSAHGEASAGEAAGAGAHGAAAAADHGESHTEAPTGMISEATGDHITSMEDVATILEGELANRIEAGEDPRAHGEARSVHLDSPEIVPRPIDPHATDPAAAASAATQPSAELYSEVLYSNPLPHVLILTAIVVGVATTSVGLSLAVRIREAYGTVEQSDLEAMDNARDLSEGAA